MKDQIVHFEDFQAKALFISHIKSLDTPHRVSVIKERKKRTNDQNSYYWACIVGPFADWIREMGNEWTDEEAHDHLREQFLRVSTPPDSNGEILETVRKTSELSTIEFSEYTEKCALYVSEKTGVPVEAPNPFYKSANEKAR